MLVCWPCVLGKFSDFYCIVISFGRILRVFSEYLYAIFSNFFNNKKVLIRKIKFISDNFRNQKKCNLF